MNQILSTKNSYLDNTTKNNLRHTKLFKKNFFKFELFFCLIISISVSCYYIFYLYNSNKKENISTKLIDDFNITHLYDNENYSVTRTSYLYESEKNSFNVIGLIEINSININYPILSTINNDLLKIAPCRFYGPKPNEVGNMCIAAHNYNSYKFFSRIKNLKNGDKINIYDLSGNKLEYIVYNSFETDYNDLSCTNQDTNGLKEITLITCNNIKDKRQVVKAVCKI